MDVGKAEDSVATQKTEQMSGNEDLSSICEEIRKGYSPCDVRIENLLSERMVI